VIRTRFTEMAGVQHPVVLGGMGVGTAPELVAAVSEAGGLGIQGLSGRSPAQVAELAADIRSRTRAPFGMNLLLFLASDEQVEAVVRARPRVFSTAWPAPDQDLAPLFQRAHGAGCLVVHMVSTAGEAEEAERAGADVIVAQGNEGGGHVGTMGSSVLVPMVVARTKVPVLAAGGFATGAGLAAALALGADGILLGTRFLATPEAPLHPRFKQVLIDSDGHDTIATEVTDVAQGTVWPGAYARVRRNRLVEDWIGREGELRRLQPEVAKRIAEARLRGDPDYAVLYSGQTAGLIHELLPAAQVVSSIVSEAESIIRSLLLDLVRNGPSA
jgi:NAD(P)H-dependent flavin oxidoreductase YrpB (nitropropane dioxygenase family)